MTQLNEKQQTLRSRIATIRELENLDRSIKKDISVDMQEYWNNALTMVRGEIKSRIKKIKAVNTK